MDFCQYILFELTMYFHIFFIDLHWQIYSQIIQARKVEDLELAAAEYSKAKTAILIFYRHVNMKPLFKFFPAKIVWRYYESTKLGHIFQNIAFKFNNPLLSQGFKLEIHVFYLFKEICHN